MAFPRAVYPHKTASFDACADSPNPGCLSGEILMNTLHRALCPTPFARPLSRLLSVMLLFTLAAALADDAALDTSTVKFNIPAQTVPAALGEFARQAKVQLFFISDGFENVRANAVFGTYTRQQALNLLLEGTGLRASLTPDSDIEIRPVSSVMGAEVEEASLLVAVNSPEKRTGAADQGAGGNGDGAEGAAERSGKQGRPLEEIVVTGTHIRGVESVGATSISFNRQELDETGFSTIGELFESLPQNLDEINIDGTSSDGVSVVASSNGHLASGVSLRGLGPGSTLVLLNGKRRPASVRGRVVDISSIPFSMVERVEVVTGGHSAVYGSDAVAGVVNIVTRKAFEGAETQIYYGGASAGAEHLNLSQTYGREFQNSGFVLGYDYRDERALDATATGLVRGPSRLGITPVPGLYRIRAPSEQHAVLFSGHYDLGPNASLYADAQYSSDQNEGGRISLYEIPGCCAYDYGGVFITHSDQYSLVTGIQLDVGKEWQIDISALRGGVKDDVSTANLFEDAGTITTLDVEPQVTNDEQTDLSSFTVVADGPLGHLGDKTISGAIGIDLRAESFKRIRLDLLAGTTEQHEDLDRDVLAVFGEIHLPLIRSNDQRLTVSLAGRYDDYSDFGDTLNPQIGIEWVPTGGLKIHGAYSQSFRAPDLFALAFSNVGRVRYVDDPTAPGTVVSLFTETGGNLDLQPEEATTYTLGVDWQPSDGHRLSLSWFSVDYGGRIDEPAASDTTALIDEVLLGDLVNRSPTPAQLDVLLNRITRLINNTPVPFDHETDDPFATFSNIVIFDNRQNNIGLEKVDGIDIQASTKLESRLGEWSFALNGTYYSDFTRNITATSPPIQQVNRPGRPVDLKLRGRIGWARSAWSANAYINYTDSYEDTIAVTPTRIDSWTTLDLTLRYDASRAVDSGVLGGFTATLGINNLLDSDPPVFLSNFAGLGFDGVNADPVGRFVSLRIGKRW